MKASYSDLNSYGRCALQFYFRDHARIQRKKRNPNLYKGSSTHGGMAEFFLALREFADATEEVRYTYGRTAVTAYYDETLETLAERNPTMFDDELDTIRELINESRELVERYLTERKDEVLSWTILHVEEEFSVTLASGDVITFTPDLVIRDRNGYVWIIDHKTTTKMPNNELPFSDLQTLLYFAGIKEMYPELRGFIFNYLRKKLPTEPRLNTTHTKDSKIFGEYFVNNVKAIDTTYEILRDFILANAPNLMGEPMHQQKLADLRDTERFFFREILPVTEAQVEAVLGDVEGTLQQMKDSETTGNYPRTILNDLAGVQACSKCEFNRICHTEILGWNVELVLEEEYEPRDPKNPYESEEE